MNTKTESQTFETPYELCPHCEHESVIPARMGIFPCTNCGVKIKSCSMCTDMKCNSCPLGSDNNFTAPDVRFQMKDKSGRGYSCVITLSDLLVLDDELDFNGDGLHEWARNAEPDDIFENRILKFTCERKSL